MKQYLSIGMVIVSSFSMVGCAYKKPANSDPQEHWQQMVETSSNGWTKGADRWFLAGEPNAAELMNRGAPYSDAISTMIVRVPDEINEIRTGGAYQVQIFGTDDHASLFILGPNEGVRGVAVAIQGNKLSLHQTEYVSPSVMKRVIVRIGIRSLNTLTQMGCGPIEAVRIRSTNLCIEALSGACGNIYLSGNVNLKRLSQAGSGSINVFGANTSALNITTSGSGTVNVIGNVGLKSITHHGSNDINIIGARSDGLNIDTDGSGKVGINGRVNLKKVQAKDKACVYIYPVNSDRIDASAYDNAQIGLAGYTHDLYVNTFDSSHFAGRYLCAQNAYVRAKDQSHVNVTASNKIFAEADKNSSIYFFGPANLLSQFTSDDARIIPMNERNWCNFNSEYRPYSYTYAHRGETVLYTYKPEELSYRGRSRSGGRSVRASEYIK